MIFANRYKLVLSFLSILIYHTGVCQANDSIRYGQVDLGIPAYPYPTIYTQPNGEKVTILLKGDGAFSWAETPDGYKLIARNDGTYCYAIPDAITGLKASTIQASEAGRRTSQEKLLIQSLNKSATFSASYVNDIRTSRSAALKSTTSLQKAFPTKGSRKLIAILVSFTDVPFSQNRQQFDDLFNLKGYSYNGATGSVSDYFYDSSFGQMNLSVKVVGPYQLKHSMAYYGAKSGTTNDVNPKEMVSEAVAAANADVDFSEYDNDKDGIADGIYIVFAGYGQESGASTDAIWSHAWSIPSVTYDKTQISRYSCSPELKGNANNNGINKYPTHIGVICHEFLHVCGLPDLYDTDGNLSGGDAKDLGSWDPMASGSWNNQGRTPPYINCYSRLALAWGKIETLPNGSNITLLPHYSSNTAYGISTITNEYYFFENRQKKGWDSYLPSHGMIAYHMQYVDSRWKNNTINTNPNQQLFDLVEASTLSNADTYAPFPGAAKVTSFNETTNPAFVNWDGTGLNRRLVGIKEENELITFSTRVKNIYLKLAHEGNPISSFSVTFNKEKVYSVNGAVKLQSNIDAGTIAASFSIDGFNQLEGSFEINEKDSVYTLALNRLDFMLDGTYATTPNTKVTVSGIEPIFLSGNQPKSIYLLNLPPSITYTVQFDNGRTASAIKTLNSSEFTHNIALPYKQYLLSAKCGSSSLAGFEIICNNISYSTNNDGVAAIYIPQTETSLKIETTSSSYHRYSALLSNSTSLSNTIDIDLILRKSQELVSVTPNPANHDRLVIYCSEAGTINLYSITGNKITSLAVTEGRNELIGNLPQKSIVLLHFKGKTAEETKRVLIL